MISNVNKNVIFVKNIPSNIIEEAIFILKEDVSEERIEEKLDIAKNEAELILQNYIDDELTDSLKRKKENVDRIQKNKKICLIIFGVIAIILGFLCKGI